MDAFHVLLALLYNLVIRHLVRVSYCLVEDTENTVTQGVKYTILQKIGTLDIVLFSIVTLEMKKCGVPNIVICEDLILKINLYLKVGINKHNIKFYR
jgi:multidrug transporter EmrE-like cation transporter